MATRDSMPIYLKDKIKMEVLHPSATIPLQEDNDVTYTIALQTRTENRAEDDAHAVNLFGTGLSIVPPPKHYFQMIASPTLYKHGYMLAPGCDIIPSNFSGELMVPLYKFNEGEDIQLPFDAVRIVLHPVIYAHVAKVMKRQIPHMMNTEYMQQPMQGYYAPVPAAAHPRGQGRSSRSAGIHMF